MPVSYPTRVDQPELSETWRDREVESLFEGGVDLHVPTFPTPFPRRMGIVEAAQDAAAAGSRAIAVPSLATGRTTVDEVDAVIDEAERVGVRRILVNHSRSMIKGSLDVCAEWAAEGADLEDVAPMYNDARGTREQRDSLDDLRTDVAAVGVDTTVVSSDCGQLNNVRPTDSCRHMSRVLLDAGCEAEEIKKMNGDHAAELLLPVDALGS